MERQKYEDTNTHYHLPSSTDLFHDAISYDAVNPKYLNKSQ